MSFFLQNNKQLLLVNIYIKIMGVFGVNCGFHKSGHSLIESDTERESVREMWVGCERLIC